MHTDRSAYFQWKNSIHFEGKLEIDNVARQLKPSMNIFKCTMKDASLNDLLNLESSSSNIAQDELLT